MPTSVSAASGHELDQDHGSKLGEKGPQDSSQSGDQNTLREELADQPGTARTQCEAHADLPLAAGGAGEREIGDVSARNQQNQANHRHQ